MKARVAAFVVLATGIVIGTAGCGLIAPQATTNHYDASDGVSKTVGDVGIRNAFLISSGDSINLVATFVNSGTETETVTIEPNASSGEVKTVDVQPGTPLVLGKSERVQWDGVSVKPGKLYPIFFTYGSKTGASVKVPVLTNDVAAYSKYSPTPVPTETATPEPTESATPGATAQPTESATPTPTATP